MKQIGPTAIGWFTAESWPELLKVAADRSNLPDTFAEFERIAGRKFALLTAQGMRLEKVVLSVPEMVAWLRAQGMQVDSMGRASFAAWVLARRSGMH